MLTIFFILCFAVLLSYHSTHAETFTIERSNFLKAVLPIGIIIHHASQIGEIPYVTKDFSVGGSIIVGIFLFISGYGLQYKKQHDDIHLYSLPYQFIKLVLPTIIPVAVYWLLYSIFGKDITNRSLTRVFEYNYYPLPYSWFVPILLLLTTLFYIVSQFVQRYFTIILSLVLYALFFIMRHYNLPIWIYQNIFCFLLGIIYKEYEELILCINKRVRITAGVVLLIISILYDSFSFIDIRTLISLMAFTVLYSLVSIVKSSIIIQLLKQISYEMYLCQGITFVVLFPLLKFPIAFTLLSVFLTITLAYLSSISTNKIKTIAKL